MPAKSPALSETMEKTLRGLGQSLRDRRKELGISATTVAEAAGMSRVTLFRIEKGEASVAMGAYLNAISALGLSLALEDRRAPKRKGAAPGLPKKIRLADYKQLKRLGWQLKETKVISPKEALDLYERNWRHVDVKEMDPREKKFLEALLAAFGKGRLLV